MYLPVEPGRLIGGRKIEDALYSFCRSFQNELWRHRSV